MSVPQAARARARELHALLHEHIDTESTNFFRVNSKVTLIILFKTAQLVFIHDAISKATAFIRR